MRGLIENIQLLIPLALFLAYRIIKAKNAETKKQQKQSGGLGELIKKIQEAQSNPEYSKSLTEDTQIYIPPKVPPQARAAQKPKAMPARQPARPVKPVPKKPAAQGVYKPSFPETIKVNEQLPSGTKSDAAAAQVSAASSLQTGFSLQGLTPLQQAVVWSEILGQPKGVSI
jgi:hypothetical protein